MKEPDGGPGPEPPPKGRTPAPSGNGNRGEPAEQKLRGKNTLADPLAQSRSCQSLRLMAATLRDDGLFPVKLRVLALNVAWRVDQGGRPTAAEIREIADLYRRRRQQLAAAVRGYR
jgi:hypothetical protein